jgi:DNA-binding MarR family transcriptional regulator
LAEDNNILRNIIVGITATVIGGLILAWVQGVIPAIWAWTLSQLLTILDIFTANASIPVWLLAILIISALPTALLIIMKIIHLIAPSKVVVAKADVGFAGSRPQLTENELLVLKTLAAKDGGNLRINIISKVIGLNQLRTEQAVESLINKDLVDFEQGFYDDDTYYLSGTGRNLVIELGYA